MSPSSSQGTQCVHQDFLRVVDMDKYQQSASMWDTMLHRTDPEVLPSRYISIMAFEFYRDDTTRESYIAALFDYYSSENLRVIQP
jgi:hypothetical protein